MRQNHFFKYFNFSNIVAFIFVAIGIIVCIVSIGYIYNGIVSSFWSNVEGMVLHSKVERVVTYSGSRIGSSPQVSFKPIINYSYFVADKEYFGNCYAFGSLNYKNADDAQNIINSFPKNSKIIVYYCKSTPHKSVLSPGLTGGAIYKLCFSICFALMGIFVWVLSNASSKRRKHSNNRVG